MWGYLSIPLGYLIGSIPTAVIFGRLMGKIDLCAEGDGHISATAVYRNFGTVPFVSNVAIDIAKGAAAVLLAYLISGDLPVVMAAGAMAVVGHCWSVFMKFRGGLGGTVIIGVLVGFAWWQALICLVAMGIIFFILHRSTLCTILLAVFMVIALYITKNDWLAATFPLILLAIQFLKRLTVKKHGSEYKNNLLSDLKRVK